MSSEDDQFPMEDPDLSQNPVIQQQVQEQMLRDYYREQRRRMAIRIALVVIGLVAASAICYHVYGPEAIKAFLEEAWPVLTAPFIGWFLGMWAVKQLYRPSGRVVVCLTPDDHMFRAVFIPDQMFRFFEQSGNNVLYHSLLGMPVYVAEHIDTDSGNIQYSWIHELNSIEVMTREETYNNWRNTLEQVLRENLELMDHPHVIGLGYARKCLRDQLDLFAETLGLTGRDFARDRSVSNPETKEESDDE